MKPSWNSVSSSTSTVEKISTLSGFFTPPVIDELKNSPKITLKSNNVFSIPIFKKENDYGSKEEDRKESVEEGFEERFQEDQESSEGLRLSKFLF